MHSIKVDGTELRNLIGLIVGAVGTGEVRVEKSRYHEALGVPGDVFMHYGRDNRSFIEIGRDSVSTYGKA